MGRLKLALHADGRDLQPQVTGRRVAVDDGDITVEKLSVDATGVAVEAKERLITVCRAEIAKIAVVAFGRRPERFARVDRGKLATVTANGGRRAGICELGDIVLDRRGIGRGLVAGLCRMLAEKPLGKLGIDAGRVWEIGRRVDRSGDYRPANGLGSGLAGRDRSGELKGFAHDVSFPVASDAPQNCGRGRLANVCKAQTKANGLLAA